MREKRFGLGWRVVTVLVAVVMVFGLLPSRVLAASAMTLSYNQNQIDSVGKQSTNSVACLGFAYAYAQTITSGTVHSWSEYDSNGGTDQAHFYGSNMQSSFTYYTVSGQQAILRKCYDSINEGRPVILWVTQTSGKQHWVTIVGYQNVTDANSLSLSNFLMLDPVHGADSTPEVLNKRNYTLRTGDNNIRVSKASTSPIPPNSDPIATLDSITTGNHTITIRGWAFDPDTPSASIGVHIYIGGSAGDSNAEVHIFTANTSRPDVNSAYGISGDHGFEITIPTLKSGTQAVHIYAINSESGNNPEFAARTVEIGSELDAPSGSAQLSTTSGYSIRPCLAPQMSLTIKDGSTTTDASIVLQPWSNVSYQAFDMAQISSGNAYRHLIVSRNSSMVLDLDCSLANFGRLIQCTRNNGYNQQWYFVSLGNNEYKIVSVLTGQCIDLPNFATAAGTVVGMCHDNGSNAQKYYLVPLSITKASVSVASQVEYSGSPVTPSVVVTSGGVTLVEGLDYSVSYYNNDAPGTGYAVVDGLGEFSGGFQEVSFKIVSSTPTIYDLSQATVSAIEDQSYTGRAISPSFTVKLNGTALTKDTDYTVAYSNNTNAGTARVTITGKGNYTGTKTVTFKINPRSMSSVMIGAIPDQTYTGSAVRPEVVAALGVYTLVEGTDYTVSYSNNTNVGTATVTITGKGNFTGTMSTTFKIVSSGTPTTDLSRAVVTLTPSSFEFTGECAIPGMTVTLDGKTLQHGTDYISLFVNAVNPGTYTYTVTGMGSYTGSTSASFTIAEPFCDVTSSTSHYEDILWLYASGVSKGWGSYPNRVFRGGNGVQRADMAAFLYRLAGSPEYTPSPTDKAYFSDVTDDTPHAKEIWWLASTGISKGWTMKDGTHQFRPTNAVTRQDMAAFLYRLAGSPTYNPSATDKAFFSDVTAETPHAKEIWWMASTGISTGWSSGSTHQFRGTNTVVRQDMAAFLHRMDVGGYVPEYK